MKIGLFITNQQHLDVDMVTALEEQYVMVRCARDRGWHYLFSGQHYLNEGDNKQLQLLPFMARLQAEGYLAAEPPWGADTRKLDLNEIQLNQLRALGYQLP